jgi:uncharacterized protein
MTANLTPDYMANEKRFKEARTPKDKLDALKDMLSTLPKHKGTEKMQSDLKRRIKTMTLEVEQAKKKGGRGSDVPRVEPEGAGQLCLVGAPNSGKSALVARLSGAPLEVADYPYTTRAPQPGMMRFEDIQFQLVDLPPVSPDYMESWLPSIVRYGDGVLLVADLGDDDLLHGLEVSEQRLAERKIVLKAPGFRPEPHAEIVEQPTLLVATKLDLPAAAGTLEVLRELYGERFPIVPVSTVSGDGLDALARAVFDLRQVVRVYTKQPGKKADTAQPFVVDRGSTVMDLAVKVHKELAERLAFARIWAEGKYDGQRVPRDHVIEDRDILELHQG